MAALLLNNLCPRPPCSLFLVLLLLFLTVFTQRSSCSRPLPHPAAGPPLNNGGVAAVQMNKIAIPTETAPMSREEELAANKQYEQLVLNRKPRGRPPPSGPSKGTNDIKN